MKTIIQLTTFLTFLLATLVSAAQYNVTGTEFYINEHNQGVGHVFLNRDTDRITFSKFVDPCTDSAALGNFTYKTKCNSGGGYFFEFQWNGRQLDFGKCWYETLFEGNITESSAPMTIAGQWRWSCKI
jgi:hypothetical protein